MQTDIYAWNRAHNFILGPSGGMMPAPDPTGGGVVRGPVGAPPPMAGPAGPPLQGSAPPQYAPGGFLRGVDRILGGPPMAGLTPQNATEARRMGLLNAGIGMLAGASHGNFADALVGGLSGGQAGYQQGIQQGYGQQDQAAASNMYMALQPRPNETEQDRLYRLHQMLSFAAAHPGPNQGAMLTSISGAIDAIQRSQGQRSGSQLNLDSPKMMMVNGKPQLAAFDGATNRWFGTDGSQLTGDIREVPKGSEMSDGQRASLATQADGLGGRVGAAYNTSIAQVKPITDSIDQALPMVDAAVNQNDPTAKLALVDTFVRAMNGNRAIRQGQLALFKDMQTLKQTVEGQLNKWTAGGGSEIPPTMVKQIAEKLRILQSQYHEDWQSSYQSSVNRINAWNKKNPNAQIDPENYLLMKPPGGVGSASSGMSADQLRRLNDLSGVHK